MIDIKYDRYKGYTNLSLLFLKLPPRTKKRKWVFVDLLRKVKNLIEEREWEGPQLHTLTTRRSSRTGKVLQPLGVDTGCVERSLTVVDVLRIHKGLKIIETLREFFFVGKERL